ncbi:hypothetical protein ACWC3X_31455 [Streptomyces populi]
MNSTPGRPAVIGDEGSCDDVTAWLASQLEALRAGRRPQDVPERNDNGWIRHIGRETYARAAGRPAGDDDATRLAVTGVCGGAWPQGVEAVVRAALAPEPTVTTPQELAHLIVTAVPGAAHRDHGPLTVERLRVGRVGLATTTGWSKARGRGHEDNEDASDFARPAGGGIVAAVLDGVSGRGDGGGGWAARRALDLVRRDWSAGRHDALEILRGMDQGLSEREEEALRYADAATVGVLCSVLPAEPEQVTLAFVGDARAYALLPGGRRAVRLGGEGSAVFEDFRDGIPPRPSEASVVTSYIGESGVEGREHVVWPEIPCGAWLVLLSDGACVTDGGTGNAAAAGAVGPGFDDWLFAADLEEAAARAVSPQHLATLLTMRSESLGGRDNATALVVEFLAPPVTRRRTGRRADVPAEALTDGSGGNVVPAPASAVLGERYAGTAGEDDAEDGHDEDDFDDGDDGDFDDGDQVDFGQDDFDEGDFDDAPDFDTEDDELPDAAREDEATACVEDTPADRTAPGGDGEAGGVSDTDGTGDPGDLGDEDPRGAGPEAMAAGPVTVPDEEAKRAEEGEGSR